jgi:hypothetical protein
MASLKEAGEQLTRQLEDVVQQLKKELANGSGDFEKLVSLADELSERADGLAETFSSVNETLMQRLQQAKGSAGGGPSRRMGSQSESKAGARS